MQTKPLVGALQRVFVTASLGVDYDLVVRTETLTSRSKSGEAPTKPLFSIGDCPVCADSGAVILLKAATFTRLLFYCPLCGAAWLNPPKEHRLDEVNALKDLAPDGVSLPTIVEALESGFDPFTVEFETWFPVLEFQLSRAGIPLTIEEE